MLDLCPASGHSGADRDIAEGVAQDDAEAVAALPAMTDFLEVGGTPEAPHKLVGLVAEVHHLAGDEFWDRVCDGFTRCL